MADGNDVLPSDEAIGQQTHGSAIGAVWSLSYRQGYDEGYRRAVRDVLSSLLLISEEFIGIRPESSQDIRGVLVPFEEHLEQRISRMSPDETFIGGLGI